MNMSLGKVKLWGRESTMPHIPSANLSGTLIADTEALIFRAKDDRFGLAIPWQAIKSCYPTWQDATDLASAAMNFMTLWIASPKEYFVVLTYFSAQDDMDVIVWFYV